MDSVARFNQNGCDIVRTLDQLVSPTGLDSKLLTKTIADGGTRDDLVYLPEDVDTLAQYEDGMRRVNVQSAESTERP